MGHVNFIFHRLDLGPSGRIKGFRLWSSKPSQKFNLQSRAGTDILHPPLDVCLLGLIAIDVKTALNVAEHNERANQGGELFNMMFFALLKALFVLAPSLLDLAHSLEVSEKGANDDRCTDYEARNIGPGHSILYDYLVTHTQNRPTKPR